MKKILGVSLASWVAGIFLAAASCFLMMVYGERGGAMTLHIWFVSVFVAGVNDFFGDKEGMPVSSWLVTWCGMFLFFSGALIFAFDFKSVSVVWENISFSWEQVLKGWHRFF